MVTDIVWYVGYLCTHLSLGDALRELIPLDRVIAVFTVCVGMAVLDQALRYRRMTRSVPKLVVAGGGPYRAVQLVPPPAFTPSFPLYPPIYRWSDGWRGLALVLLVVAVVLWMLVARALSS